MSFQSLPSVSSFQTSFRLFEFSIQTLVFKLFSSGPWPVDKFCKEEKGRTVSTNTLRCKFYDVTCSVWKRNLSTQFRIPRIPQSYFLVDTATLKCDSPNAFLFLFYFVLLTKVVLYKFCIVIDSAIQLVELQNVFEWINLSETFTFYTVYINWNMNQRQIEI